MNSHKIVKGFFPRYLFSFLNSSLLSSLSHIIRSSSSMMSISNISSRYLIGELLWEEIWISDTTFPEGVHYLISCLHICVWLLCLDDLHHLLLYRFTTPECKENWTYISRLSINEFSSVFFFLISSQFMSLNFTLLIIFYRGLCNYPILTPFTHSLHINIHAWLRILY